VKTSHAPREGAPLAGLRVADFSHVIAGPFASYYLCQMGAHVTKIEPRLRCEPLAASQSGRRTYTALNAGKRIVRLDLTDDADCKYAKDLAADCDILVDSLRGGVLDKFGLGYAQVTLGNPRIIYCAISGYGRQTEHNAQRGAYDHVVQALSGMVAVNTEAGMSPSKIGFPLIDSAAGILAALAIVSHLHERNSTGKGMFIDVPMWAAALQLMYPMTCEAMSGGAVALREGNRGFSGSPAADIFRCKRGWLALGANTPPQLAAFYAALEWPVSEFDGDVVDGSGFVRATDPNRMRERIASALLEREACEWEDRLAACGVPSAAVRSLPEFVAYAESELGLAATDCRIDDAAPVRSPGLGWLVDRSNATIHAPKVSAN
jgi:crotonobetainyl-CoA:carnitine CoA-transferase CaiB-like acyl-CoA transferase